MDFKSICQNKTKNDWAKYSLTKLFLVVLTFLSPLIAVDAKNHK